MVGRAGTTMRGLALGAVAALSLTGPAMAAGPAGDCNRACLTEVMDRYLAAVAARTPAKAPLSASVKFTENAVRLKPGQGLWATATGVGEARHVMADPGSGQVAYLGTMVEQGVPVLAAIRLKAPAGRITEAETLIVRPSGGLFDPKAMNPQKGFLDVTPPARRLSRAELVRIASLYFDGLEQDTGEIVPFDPACNRIENGVQTTNNPNRHSTVGVVDIGLSSLGCKAGFNTRMYAYITAIDGRRWLVDEEHQTVLGLVRFVHDGTLTHTDVPGVGKVEFSAKRPFDVQMFEAFHVVDGKIREVAAVGSTLPYLQPSGW